MRCKALVGCGPEVEVGYQPLIAILVPVSANIPPVFLPCNLF
jgi:hypothetical protein